MRRGVLVLSAIIVLAGIAVGVGMAFRGGHTARRARAPHVADASNRQVLFAQDAHAGTLTPKGHGEYRLTLTGVHPNALYFADRPYRLVGATPVQHMLDGLFKKEGRDLPNAAINAVDPRTGHQALMGAELLAARYDVAAARLTYRLRTLPQGPPDQREHGRTDVVLPQKLSHTSVFVDDLYHQCWATLYNYVDRNLTYDYQSKWSTDDLYSDINKPSYFATIAPGDNAYWGSVSGFARGCSNSGGFDAADLGSVSISVSDPWSSGNTFSCTVTGDPNVLCLPSTDPDDQVSWRGDTLQAVYYLCSTDWQIAWAGSMTCDVLARNGSVKLPGS